MNWTVFVILVSILAPASTTCVNSILDIVFVIDSSGSIRDKNPSDGSYDNWAFILDFVANLIKKLNIGRDATHIGLVEYSDIANSLFFLNTYDNEAQTMQAVRDAPHIGNYTNTSAGLRLMTFEQFSGGRGDRPNVPNVAIVITDGVSNRDKNRTLPDALVAQRRGIQMFSVGVGPNLNMKELQGLSSPPQQRDVNYYISVNFTQLERLSSNLISQLCITSSQARPDCLLSYQGSKYLGNVSVTQDGLSCQTWAEQKPHEHNYTDPTLFPDATLEDAANHCRNPDDQPEGPWCYTTDTSVQWGFCDIPICTKTTDAATNSPKPQECLTSALGWEYVGHRSVTANNRTCQAWRAQVPTAHNYTNPDTFPDSTLRDAANYCRMPAGSDSAGVTGPWCYTTDTDVRWEQCDIPKCPTDGGGDRTVVRGCSLLLPEGEHNITSWEGRLHEGQLREVVMISPS